MPCKRKNWKIINPKMMNHDMRVLFREVRPVIAGCDEGDGWFQIPHALKLLVGHEGRLQAGTLKHADKLLPLQRIQEVLIRMSTNIGGNAQKPVRDLCGLTQRISGVLPYCPPDVWDKGATVRLVSPDKSLGLCARRKADGKGTITTSVLWKFIQNPQFETTNYVATKRAELKRVGIPVDSHPVAVTTMRSPPTVSDDASTLAEMIQGVIDKRIKEATAEANREIASLRATLEGIKKAVSF